MTSPELDTIIGGIAGFVLAALGVTKLWRDTSRNTAAIEGERAAREKAIKDLHENTERKLLAVEQKMSDQINGVQEALIDLRGDIAEYRMDNTQRYLSKESAKDMENRVVGAIEKLDNRVRDGFKTVFDKLERKVDK